MTILSWQDFLSNEGAIRDEYGVTHFTSSMPETTTAPSAQLFDLSHLGIINVHGKDAALFLQGQLTNDIKQVSKTSGQISCYCDNKGRVLAIFHIISGPLSDITSDTQAYCMITNNQIMAAVTKKLSMYIMRSAVTISDLSTQATQESSEEHAVIGYQAQAADNELATIVGALPTLINATVQFDGINIMRCHGDSARYLISGPQKEVMELWQKLSPHCARLGYPAWERENIRAQLPDITASTTAQFIPQMLGLDQLDALNFNKGCYVGQEIIARIKYLGKVKRTMVACQIHAENNTEYNVAAGAKICALKDDQAISAGTVLCVQQHDTSSSTDEKGQHYIALVVIDKNHLANTTLHLEKDVTATITLN